MRHLIRMNSPGIVKKKTARKKNNMRKYDLRHKYDFCCECEIVNQLKSFTNSVAKLTHKHIRRDFQFKVFSSFFFSVFIVVVVVPVIAVLLLWLCVSCCWIGNYRAAPGWGPHAATACALLLIEIAAREPSQAEPSQVEPRRTQDGECFVVSQTNNWHSTRPGPCGEGQGGLGTMRCDGTRTLANTGQTIDSIIHNSIWVGRSIDQTGEATMRVREIDNYYNHLSGIYELLFDCVRISDDFPNAKSVALG